MTNTLAELREALEPLFDSIPLMPVTLSGEQVLRIVVASRCLEAGSVPDEPSEHLPIKFGFGPEPTRLGTYPGWNKPPPAGLPTDGWSNEQRQQMALGDQHIYQQGVPEWIWSQSCRCRRCYEEYERRLADQNRS